MIPTAERIADLRQAVVRQFFREGHRDLIRRIREVSKETGHFIGVLVDLMGPRQMSQIDAAQRAAVIEGYIEDVGSPAALEKRAIASRSPDSASIGPQHRTPRSRDRASATSAGSAATKRQRASGPAKRSPSQASAAAMQPEPVHKSSTC